MLVLRKEIIEGVQVWYASVCESPITAYNAGFLSIDGCGDGTFVIGVRVYLSGVNVVSDQDGYPSSTHGCSVPSGG